MMSKEYPVPRLTRVHFTLLAEMIGDIQSGVVDSGNIEDYVASRFRLFDQPNFDHDKFYRHVDVQWLNARGAPRWEP